MNDKPTILIVHDLAELVSKCLSDSGYTTMAATSIDEGLSLWNAQVDVLLTTPRYEKELVLPLLEQKPSLKFLFISGLLFNEFKKRGTVIPLEKGVNFMQTPFDSEELLRFVENGVSLES